MGDETDSTLQKKQSQQKNDAKPQIDFEEVLEFFGEKKLLFKIKIQFLTSMNEQFEKINTAFKNNNAITVKMEAHSIKVVLSHL